MVKNRRFRPGTKVLGRPRLIHLNLDAPCQGCFGEIVEYMQIDLAVRARAASSIAETVVSKLREHGVSDIRARWRCR